MKKFIKLFVLGSVITSFLLCLFFGFSVNAEEVENTEPTTQEEQPEVQEQETTTTQEEVNQVIDEAQANTNEIIEYFKGWTMGDIKAWISVACTKLGIDTLTILGFVIYFIRSKVKDYKQNEFYKELTSKMDAEHQAKMEELIAEFDFKLEEVQKAVVDTLNQQDEAKRKEAEANLDTLKAQIENLKADIEK